jgi:hypothetical protein
MLCTFSISYYDVIITSTILTSSSTSASLFMHRCLFCSQSIGWKVIKQRGGQYVTRGGTLKVVELMYSYYPVDLMNLCIPVEIF